MNQTRHSSHYHKIELFQRTEQLHNHYTANASHSLQSIVLIENKLSTVHHNHQASNPPGSVHKHGDNCICLRNHENQKNSQTKQNVKDNDCEACFQHPSSSYPLPSQHRGVPTNRIPYT